MSIEETADVLEVLRAPRHRFHGEQIFYTRQSNDDSTDVIWRTSLDDRSLEMTVVAMPSPSIQPASAARADCRDPVFSGTQGPSQARPAFANLLRLNLAIRLRGKKIASFHQSGQLPELGLQRSCP